MEGLEPTHLSVLEPKSSASTNSATSATCSLSRSAKLEAIAQKSKALFHFFALFYEKIMTKIHIISIIVVISLDGIGFFLFFMCPETNR